MMVGKGKKQEVWVDPSALTNLGQGSESSSEFAEQSVIRELASAVTIS